MPALRRHQAPSVIRRPATLTGAVAALALVLVSTLGAAAAPGPALAQGPVVMTSAGTTPLGDAVTFYGRGYGHGVGMSQYGARGRALTGQDAPTILAHYYQGTTLAPIDPATRIRVLVQSRWIATGARPLVLYGRLAPWSIDGIASAFPSDARLRLIPTGAPAPAGTPGTWRLVVDATDGTVLLDGTAPADLTVRPATEDGRLQLRSKPTSFDQYRGTLRILLHSPTRLSVVNDVGLEQYLGGVVPVEMPSTWPAAALQAQSIAARSYAARRLRPAVSYFDVPDDSSSQVYRGFLAEKAATNAAIAATAGTVLMSGSTIANAMFHSTGGGATESNENVYTSASGKRTARPVGYLRGAQRPGARRDHLRRERPVRDLADRDLHHGPAGDHLRGRSADQRRGHRGHRPARPRRVRPPRQRHPDRLARHTEGVRRGLPGGLQRPPSERRPKPQEHPPGRRADPLNRAIVGGCSTPEDAAPGPVRTGPSPTS